MSAPIRVLCVDDNADEARSTGRLLEGAGSPSRGAWFAMTTEARTAPAVIQRRTDVMSSTPHYNRGVAKYWTNPASNTFHHFNGGRKVRHDNFGENRQFARKGRPESLWGRKNLGVPDKPGMSHRIFAAIAGKQQRPSSRTTRTDQRCISTAGASNPDPPARGPR